MPELIVIARDGEKQVVEAAENETLMEIIRETGLEGMDAICGGCCSCATCHIFVDPDFVGKLPPVSEDEDMLLDGSLHRKPDVSRLSCQIRMTPEMNGMSVEIAPED